MDGALLNPRLPGTKARQAQDAKDMQRVVTERLTKKGLDVPAYEFLELIGKGSYGRVYRSKNRTTQQVCAVKIIEVDDQDYQAGHDARDDTIREFIRETSILQSLKDNKARNVNIIYDAFSVDTQLWIVSEYCPGGSLTTLMKATPAPGLAEQFIIPIAREVAIALKYVHDAGIIHRDIKCANILVTEDGRIQLCDFGISGVLENEVSKRSTIVGTPHWMAPELVSHLGSNMHNIRYGTEIDCWAFGCAIFEMSTGHPPNSRVRPENLGMALHSRAPRLEDEKFSAALRDFAAYCLQQQADKRPSSEQIMQHQYVANTSKQYPTESIRVLIENYAVWEQSGGGRMSLFNPMGPAGPEALSPFEHADEEWNFSTTMEFDRRISMHLDSFPDGLAKPSTGLEGIEKIVEEAKAKRGEMVLGRLFNHEEKPYSYGEKRDFGSDLPLRSYSDATAGSRETLIDLDAAVPTFNDIPSLELVDPPTLKARAKKFRDREDEIETEDFAYDTARRATKDWTMNLNVDPPDDNSNRRTQDWTFPKMSGEDELTPKDNTSLDVGTVKPSIQNRRTQDWKFPTDDNSMQKENIQNRRTQDWKFPTSEEMGATETARHTPSFTSTNSMLDVPRPPPLKHSKTSPATLSDSFASNATSPDRESMIDLDGALVIEIPDLPHASRSSPSHSATNSAATDMTSGDPFDLEEQILLSKENSRTSLHMKSQSEPTAGFLDAKTSRPDSREYGSDLDSVHNRSSSMNRSDRDRSTSRPPGMSVRYRQRRPTALQKHWAEKHGPGSGGSTGHASRAGSFDSSMSDNPQGFRMSWDPFGDTDEENLRDENGVSHNHVGERARRQKASDGASTASIKSDEYLANATLRPSKSRDGGKGAPPAQMTLPYTPNPAALFPGDNPADLHAEMMKVLDDFRFQADRIRQLILYHGQVQESDIREYEDGPHNQIHSRTASQDI